MQTHGSWNWRLMYIKQSRWHGSDHWWPIWRWLSELTVLFLHIAPLSLLSIRALAPLGEVEGGRALDRCLPHQHLSCWNLKSNKLSFSPTWPDYWIWNNEQLHPTDTHTVLVTVGQCSLQYKGKTTRPFWNDLNEILYDYTVEMMKRFKGLDLIDWVP